MIHARVSSRGCKKIVIVCGPVRWENVYIIYTLIKTNCALKIIIIFKGGQIIIKKIN